MINKNKRYAKKLKSGNFRGVARTYHAAAGEKVVCKYLFERPEVALGG